MKEDIITVVKQLKPMALVSYSDLFKMPFTFANLLMISCGKHSPMYIDVVSDVIAPLSSWLKTSKAAVAPLLPLHG